MRKRRASPESLIATEPSLKDPSSEKLDEVEFRAYTGGGNPVKHPQHYVSQLHDVEVSSQTRRRTRLNFVLRLMEYFGKQL